MSDGVSGFTSIRITTMLQDFNSPKIKKYFVSDGDGDPTDIYYAQAAAIDTEDCLRQRLSYVTASGIKTIQKETWESDSWDSTWDLN